MKPIEFGTRVMFARKFLQNIGASTGDLPRDVGVVVQLREATRYTPASALVQWDHGNHSWSLLKNLVREDSLHLEAQ